jgi:hypothetical protein
LQHDYLRRTSPLALQMQEKRGRLVLPRALVLRYDSLPDDCTKALDSFKERSRLAFPSFRRLLRIRGGLRPLGHTMPPHHWHGVRRMCCFRWSKSSRAVQLYFRTQTLASTNCPWYASFIACLSGVMNASVVDNLLSICLTGTTVPNQSHLWSKKTTRGTTMRC